jgi:glycine/D-amino acid oxidase-like deaminating enzyme
MDLRSEFPYWSIRNGLLHAYPSLQQSVRTDVAVIGAGITGALISYRLMEAGLSVVVTDRRHVGMGSTSASTALLQYEIDTHLTQLAEWYGLPAAREAYSLCLEAIDRVHDLCREVGVGQDFRYAPSLYYATFRKDLPDLYREYQARRAAGIGVEWIDEALFRRLYPFSAPGAILSEKAAEVDPYRLAHALLERVAAAGNGVHNQTEIVRVTEKRGGVELETGDGHRITAGYLVVAAGYESERWLGKQPGRLHSSYALVSEPTGRQELWKDNCLMWETARPYLYFRTTTDGRVIAGGRDDTFQSPGKRDRRVFAKSRQLEADVRKRFPELPFRTDFCWAGTFAETEDGLPFIGRHPGHPRTWFSMGFGGNGITFSSVAADSIAQEIAGVKKTVPAIFSFHRKRK